ncbi:MAG: hypothetical protein ACREE0_07425 [Phenylobacterium sp.]
MPANVLTALTGPAAYKVCRLLRAPEFAKFGEARGLKVDERRLRHLERLGLLKPLLRIRRNDDVRKIETLPGHRYRDLGSVEEGEDWTGETRIELLGFGFYPHVVESWIEHGVLWSPIDGPSAHDREIDGEPSRHTAYYSEFQIWDLMLVLQQMDFTLHAENALDEAGEPNGHHDLRPTQMVEIVRAAIAARTRPNFREMYGLLSQLISDRFYPQTQTDGRQMTTSVDGTFHGWNWDDYARAWTSDETIAAFELDRETSARWHDQLCVEQAHHNPLHAWRALTGFVASAERKRLKGAALLAETLAEMAEMLRRLHLEAFDEVLTDPRDTTFPRNSTAAPAPEEDDPYAALELVANTFHVNPKPRLVMIVEGETEDAAIPDIFFRWFGATAARFGIQLRNMHGVGNATGDKKDRRSALWRLVDFLHAQQTVALVLLDNEGLAGTHVAQGLRNARSIHVPDRMVTRPDYIKLWARCFELDNFSNTEIARALSAQAGVAFKPAEIEACRAKPVPKAKAVTLGSVFEGRTGRGLDKVALARHLVEIMFAPETRRKIQSRPIVRFVEFAAEKAQLNHQPTLHGRRTENQRSGYFGALHPSARRRRREKA